MRNMGSDFESIPLVLLPEIEKFNGNPLKFNRM
jgi:hypothetical protein